MLVYIPSFLVAGDAYGQQKRKTWEDRQPDDEVLWRDAAIPFSHDLYKVPSV